MILLSICRNKGYLSWVIYGDGKVQSRGTKESVKAMGFEAIQDVGYSLEEALKALNLFLETKVSKLTNDDFIQIETSYKKIYDWLMDMNIADKYVGFVEPCLKEFQKLPLPVRVVYKSNAGLLYANKYNSADFVTSSDIKVFKATDIF